MVGGYRLFDCLFSPDPHEVLTSGALKNLQQLEPFIRDLEDRQQGKRLLATDILIVNHDY